MRELLIDLDRLLDAVESAHHGFTTYLDSETGEIHSLPDDALLEADEPGASDGLGGDWLEDDLEVARRILADSQRRFRCVPDDEPHEGYRDMCAFIATIDDSQPRDLLSVAIDGPGAFGRFRNVLERFPDLRERWFDLKRDRIIERLRGWLEVEGIAPAE